MKRDKMDIIFSKLVRERANWTCEVCGTHYPEGKRQGLECSHFFTRSKRSTRWHPKNAAAHCTKCHFHLGGNPIEFAEWIEGHLGKPEAEALRLKANTPLKFTKTMKADLYQEMKAEMSRLEALRSEGETGRLEFELENT